MAVIRVNKIEAAQRQIDAAIEMLFQGMDALAVFTLISAAERILRDICAARGTPFYTRQINMIRPGMEKEFWAAVNKPVNFLKHADRDADETLDNIDEKVNDMKILVSCVYYTDLGNHTTHIMHAFLHWFNFMNPNLIADDAGEIKQIISDSHFDSLRNASREEQFEFGRELLRVAHTSAVPRVR